LASLIGADESNWSVEKPVPQGWARRRQKFLNTVSVECVLKGKFASHCDFIRRRQTSPPPPRSSVRVSAPVRGLMTLAKKRVCSAALRHAPSGGASGFWLFFESSLSRLRLGQLKYKKRAWGGSSVRFLCRKEIRVPTQRPGGVVLLVSPELRRDPGSGTQARDAFVRPYFGRALTTPKGGLWGTWAWLEFFLVLTTVPRLTCSFSSG